MIPFSGIFCDMDGTIADTERLRKQAVMRMYAAHQKLIPEYILENREKLFCRNTLRWMAENEDSEVVRSLGLTREEREKWIDNDFRLLYGEKAVAKNGAIETIRYLHEQGVPMALVTATEMEYAIPCLKHFGILEYFDPIICTLDIPLNKGNPELFEQLAGKWGVDVKQCLLLDDALYAVRGAKAAGCTVYAVKELVWGEEAGKQVQETADKYFEDLSGVLAELKKQE